MKKTSKILSMVLALVMIMSAMIIPVSADSGPYAEMTVVADRSQVEIGEYVSVEVVLSENSNLSVVTIDLNYDSSAFVVDTMYNNGMFTDSDGDVDEAFNPDYADGKARFVGVDSDSVTDGGTLFTVVFLAVGETSGSEFSLSVEEAADPDYTEVFVFTNTVSVAVLYEIEYPSLTVVADENRVEIGDIVTVDVYLSENSELGTLTADLIFDSSVFKPVSMTANGLFTNIDLGTEMCNKNYADGEARFSAANRSVITEGGVLFTVVFEVIGDAENSVMWVSVAEAADGDYNDVYVETYDAWFNEIIDIYFFEPSRTTIRHKDGIKLYYYTTSPLPEGWYVVFDYDNENFDVEYNEEDDSYTIISAKNGYTTFDIILLDDNDNIVSSDTLEMRSKAGFFDKIGSFFRSIFGGTTIYEY